MFPILDPRRGDIEDDASSTKRRTLTSLAGSLLAEISLPKLIAAWVSLVALPVIVLGLGPLMVSIWVSAASTSAERLFNGLIPLVVAAALVAAAWFGGRPFLRLVEANFWSLNALAVQPGYALAREGLRHLAERNLPETTSDDRRDRIRAVSAAAAGLLVCGLSMLFVVLALPHTHWTGTLGDLAEPGRLALAGLFNCIVLIGCYVAVAALVWGVADATMDQPRDLGAFAPKVPGGRTWRVAHLSDIHIVGERYGFRIESGRSGPRGNGRLTQLLVALDAFDKAEGLDLILISGDLTDAGRAAEWAEFFDAIAAFPELAGKMVGIPGNHDLNVVDRANPARLDLPMSPNKRLRQMRLLAALDALQGDRVHVVDTATGMRGQTLSAALAPHASEIATFADTGTLRLGAKLGSVFAAAFPMVLPPEATGGLGVLMLNSNAETHFSFTNALGFVPREQEAAMARLVAETPDAIWIVALHHHVVEYPRAAKALSERIGTALVNGSWFTRRLQGISRTAIAMHGHRHIDWIGRSGGLVVVSAPSPVMNATDEEPTYFYIHEIGRDTSGGILLHPPHRIDVPGEPRLRRS
ncbi:Calcineurin-like phosphoesterase [Kaistia soli DSM 19436]|uniref:Calcineurin-like phosphoesterase n=1 Tax=Kaistia soli DSM 19436 TaxID=1122133 RepID=A0A1M5IMU6_9HYPH|nr:metallophosphoesterase [Kaistia soli]SHG29369.1 Calcineurin-like phosphoesterase [Kaistia soli DSM 19436]